MAYSTITELRNNIVKLTVTEMADAQVTPRIAEADKCVKTDLGRVVDFTLVTDTPTGCPVPINQLSQYKTCELSLVFKYSAKRMDMEQTDYMYWQKAYNDLLARILAGEVTVGTPATTTDTFEQDHRKGIEPALGQGMDGEWVDDDDLEAIRSDLGSQED